MTVDVWSGLAERLDVMRSRPALGSWVVVRRFDLPWGNSYAIAGNRRELLYYNLTPAEADVLELVDGTRTVGEIVVEHLRRSGELDMLAIVELVRSLFEGNFLTERYVDTGAALERALHPHRGLRSGAGRFLTTLSAEWTGAERMVRWIYRHGMRHLFHPLGVVTSAIVALAGFVAFFAVIASHQFHLTTQSVGIGFVILFTLNLAIVFVHELGHAALLVHYDGRVKSAGFRIYFGSPCFFVESSDALLLRRGQRIAQAFAGPYVEMVVTALASILLWAVPRASFAPVLYRFCLLNYFVLFLNLVPLLELDGYWILSDVIQVPDLRPRSLAFARHDGWAKLARRERWHASEVGLALYATLGVAFTIACFFTAYFFWRRTFGGAISKMWHGGPVGVALLIVLVLFLTGPVIRALGAALRAMVRRIQGWWRAARFRSQRRWRVEAAELLDAQPGFADLPAEVLSEIAGRVQLRTVSTGTTVIRQGERADAYYVVRRGTLDVINEDRDSGATELRRRVEPGKSFGDFGLATGAPRSATVRATSRAELFVIDKGTFDRLLADRIAVPGFAPTFAQLDELRALPAFSSLGPLELDHLAHTGEWVNLPPGHVLMEQGAPGDDFFALGAGRVEIVRDGQRTRERGPGEHVGELALLLDQPRIATVRTLTPVRAFRLDRAAFDTLLRDAFRRGKVRPDVAVDRSWET